MRRCAGLWLAVGLMAVVPLSAAYEPARARQAFAAELVECASFYLITARGAGRQGDTEAADNARAAADLALRLASEVASAEAVNTALEKFLEVHAVQAGSDFAQYAALAERHGPRCKSTLEDPQRRMRDWLNR